MVGGPRYDAIKWFTDTSAPGRTNLPEALHDEGYDVFIANPRGTKYSRGHTHLSAEHEHEYYGRQKYWDWGAEDLALTDIPAMVDKIIETRKYDMNLCQKVQIVTHGQAGNYGLMLLNEHPETAEERIQSLITQSPCFCEDAAIYEWKEEYNPPPPPPPEPVEEEKAEGEEAKEGEEEAKEGENWSAEDKAGAAAKDEEHDIEPDENAEGEDDHGHRRRRLKSTLGAKELYY